MEATDGLRGLIFNLVRGSFVDGYGIRTTVFLKGCPLRCLWCCNPEGQHGSREIKFTVELCNGCGRCIRVCTAGAISWSVEEKPIIDRASCTQCGECVEVCYTGALDFFGRYVTVEELFDIVRKDEMFYRKSGGGVTLGGGEPTFQPRFVASFLQRCKEGNIHVALDTCGYTLTSQAYQLLEEADLLLFDLKGMDPDQHLRSTMVSNELILTNLKRLNAVGKPIIIRVPLVPGHTDSDWNVAETARFLATLQSVQRVDLIPYHEYGKVKYLQLGREYRLSVMPPSQARVEAIKRVFLEHGLNVQVGG